MGTNLKQKLGVQEFLLLDVVEAYRSYVHRGLVEGAFIKLLFTPFFSTKDAFFLFSDAEPGCPDTNAI